MTDLTPEQRAATPCFIGRTTKPTEDEPVVGTVVCAAVDDDRSITDTAKVVAKWIRQGLAVERVPAWWVREHFGTADVYREEVA